MSFTERLAAGTSRRGFLARAGRALTLAAGGAVLGSTVKPGEADAYHFCGHTYTTGSCPHPTGIPRVDIRGFPLRARDGVPVDDLGRRIDRQGRPLDEVDWLGRPPRMWEILKSSPAEPPPPPDEGSGFFRRFTRSSTASVAAVAAAGEPHERRSEAGRGTQP